MKKIILTKSKDQTKLIYGKTVALNRDIDVEADWKCGVLYSYDLNKLTIYDVEIVEEQEITIYNLRKIGFVQHDFDENLFTYVVSYHKLNLTFNAGTKKFDINAEIPLDFKTISQITEWLKPFQTKRR